MEGIDKEAFRELTIETEKDEAKLQRRLMLVEKKMLEVSFEVNVSDDLNDFRD